MSTVQKTNKNPQNSLNMSALRAQTSVGAQRLGGSSTSSSQNAPQPPAVSMQRESYPARAGHPASQASRDIRAEAPFSSSSANAHDDGAASSGDHDSLDSRQGTPSEERSKSGVLSGLAAWARPASVPRETRSAEQVKRVESSEEGGSSNHDVRDASGPSSARSSAAETHAGELRTNDSSAPVDDARGALTPQRGADASHAGAPSSAPLPVLRLGKPAENQNDELMQGEWQKNGGAEGWLGNPTSPIVDIGESPWERNPALMQTFEGGSIVRVLDSPILRISDRSAIRTLSAARTAAFIESGGPRSVTGLPLTDEYFIQPSYYGTMSKRQPFEGGIMYTHVNGEHAGTACLLRNNIMADRYHLRGGKNSWLGLPVSNDYASNGSLRQDFEGGYMVRHPSGEIEMLQYKKHEHASEAP